MIKPMLGCLWNSIPKLNLWDGSNLASFCTGALKDINGVPAIFSPHDGVDNHCLHFLELESLHFE